MRFRIPSTGISNFDGLDYIGESSVEVTFLCSLSHADLRCLTFYSGDDLERVKSIRAGILIVNESFKKSVSSANSDAIIFSANPKLTFIGVIAQYFDDTFSDQRVLEIDGARLSIDSYVEEGARVDSGSAIYPNATVYGCVQLGAGCVVQSGTVLGGNGLGDVFHQGAYTRFVHLGGVKVGSDVSFGANNVVPRGMLENTTIGSGSRVGNNVNIGHSSTIGHNVYISSGVTIGGACVIEDNCWIAPGVSMTDHVTVGENTMIGAGSVLTKDALKDSFYLGNPARKISARK